MNITKFVRRTEKWLLGAILVLLIVGLVVWSVPGGNIGGQGDESKLAGEFKDRFGKTIKITQADFLKQKQKVLAFISFERYLYLLRYKTVPEPIKEAEVNKNTWDFVILLHDANLNNIYVEDADVQNRIYQHFGGRPTKELYEQTVNVTNTTSEIFEESIRDEIKIENLLMLLASSEFPSYSDMFKDFEQGNKLAKIKYVSLDPKDFKKEIPQPSDAQVEKYFNDHKEEFRIANKIQLDYILVDADKIKDTLQPPSQDQISQYYEQNKSDYEIKDNPQGGDKKYEQLTEVTPDITSKLKEKNATTKAYEIAQRINLAIGNELSKTTSDKVNLQAIAQGNNATYDITPFFDKGRISDIEKLIGGGAKIDEAFSIAKGEISPIINTTKGSILYRLVATQDSYVPTPLLEDITDKVVKAVQKEDAEKLAKKKAQEISDEITKNDCEKVGKKYNLTFESSGYFDKTGKVDNKLSGSAKSVDNALVSKAFTLKVGEAAYVEVGGKPDIIYLEDIRPVFEDIDKKLDEVRKGKLDDKRLKKMEDIKKQMTQIEANLQDYMKSEKR